MNVAVDKRWELLSLQTALPVVTASVEFLVILFWSSSDNSIYSLLHLHRKSLDSYLFGSFKYVERAVLAFYGVAIIFLEVKAIQSGIFDEAQGIHQKAQILCRLILWLLLPLFAACLVFVGLGFITSSEVSLIISLSSLFCISALTLLSPQDIQKRSSLIRGATLLSFNEAQAISRELTINDPHPIFFGGVYLPSKAARHHSLIVGEPGAGKSKSIQLLMESSLCRIGEGFNHRAVIYDPKRNTRSILSGMNLNCEVKLLDPFDSRSAAWDLGKDITDPDVARTILRESSKIRE